MRLECKLENAETIAGVLNNLSVGTDMVTSLCGNFLGEGAFREVFEYNLDPEKYVIKIEKGNTSCNIVEYKMWEEISGLRGELAWVKNWFAPVKWMSPNGKILVMERTFSTPQIKKGHREPRRPDKIPKFLWDVKLANFGWLGKNFVCHDYGQFHSFIHYPKTMQKTTWSF